MDTGVLVGAGLVVALGLAGTVLPLVPGLPLIWVGAVSSWWVTGWSGAAWATTVLLTLLLLAGTVTKYWLPGRSARDAGTPRRVVVVAALVGVVAAVAIPVVGFPIGFAGTLLVGERRRLGDSGLARTSTVATLKGFGVGVLVELAAGLTMAATWLVIALAT